MRKSIEVDGDEDETLNHGRLIPYIDRYISTDKQQSLDQGERISDPTSRNSRAETTHESVLAQVTGGRY